MPNKRIDKRFGGPVATCFSALFLLTTPATAKAIRPIMKTETALKNLRMTLPVDFQETVDKNTIGLEKETPAVQKTLLKQAQDYISYRKGSLSQQKWDAGCDKNKDETGDVTSDGGKNYYCSFDEENNARQTIHASSHSHSESSAIASLLKVGDFEGAAAYSYQQIVHAVNSIASIAVISEIAGHALEQKSCVPSAVTASLGAKLEEAFPDPAAVQTSKSLYEQASKCGENIAAANASFRLGLIEISEHNCADIKGLMLKVEKTPGASPYHARAKYWRYYCGGILNDAVAKQDAKDSLVREHPLSFQNLAVSGDDQEVLSRVLHAQDPQIAFRSLVRPDLNGMIQAVEALITLKAPQLATEILDRNVMNISSLEPEVQLYTALLLNRMGSALPKFKILSSLFEELPRMVSPATMKLYFPLWYFDLVKEKQALIDPFLLLSLIRQESAFNKEARSTVGARGLMQVMPATARLTSAVRSRSLYDPKTNINVGTKYLLGRLHQYGGDVELTLAAYNAGFARVDSWRKRYPTDNKLLFLDFIPYRETRDYVTTILRNYYWYVKLYEKSATERALASITPATGTAKVNAGTPKTIAIMSGNAGLAAGVSPAP